MDMKYVGTVPCIITHVRSSSTITRPQPRVSIGKNFITTSTSRKYSPTPTVLGEGCVGQKRSVPEDGPVSKENITRYGRYGPRTTMYVFEQWSPMIMRFCNETTRYFFVSASIGLDKAAFARRELENVGIISQGICPKSTNKYCLSKRTASSRLPQATNSSHVQRISAVMSRECDIEVDQIGWSQDSVRDTF